MKPPPEQSSPDVHPAQEAFAHAPTSVSFKKLRKRITRQVREAISLYGMDTPNPGGDQQKWLVCLSGGKDSYGLLATLLDLKWHGALNADLLACNLDQGQPGFPAGILPAYLQSIGAQHLIVRQDTYSVVTKKIPEGKTFCSLCSRLRRGVLYRVAREQGCDAIVLGHHRDDALETFMLNLLHGGQLAAMPPRLLNDEGDLFVLRPMILCAEKDLAKFAELMKFPIIPCDLCGSQDGLQRAAMKSLLDQWESKRPGVRGTMFRALQNVRPGHLADQELFDFAAIERRMASPD
ncbi:MAG: tRNA 2-thiocytidine(32) synthetase TtcA [Alphaproteobacteria bacterium]|nr:tRNA 2-thiocytidine(32) synthetase TtcA [Alphaproteobacteria bacterium]